MNGAAGVILRQLRKQITRPNAGKDFEQGGFTIIEVMIVLVVTTALFISAALLVGGRQSRVEFSQSVNDFKGRLEQTVNQVGSGYYADTAAFTGRRCQVSGSTFTFAADSTVKKGSSGDCMFMGQAYELASNDATGANLQDYVVYTVAGLRALSDGKPVRNFAQANPRLLAQDGTSATATFPDAGQTQQLRGGLRVYKAVYKATASSAEIPIGGFAFLSNVGDYDAGGSLGSGTQALSVYPLLPSGMPNTSSAQNFTRTDKIDFIRKVNANLKNLDPATHKNPAGGVQICLQSGGTDQSALITIASGGRALAVNTQIKTGLTC